MFSSFIGIQNPTENFKNGKTRHISSIKGNALRCNNLKRRLGRDLLPGGKR